MNDRTDRLTLRSRFERTPLPREGLTRAAPAFGEIEERFLRRDDVVGFEGFDFAAVKTLDQVRLQQVAGNLVDTGGNAFIFGGAGTGKTRLALALAVLTAKKRRTVRYLDDHPEEDFNEDVWEDWHMDTAPPFGPRHDLVHCDLLIVDEIMRKSPKSRVLLAQILLSRFRAKRATVITTCHKPAEIIYYDMLPLFDPSEPADSDDQRDYLAGVKSLPFDRLRTLADMPSDEVRALSPPVHVWSRDELHKLSTWPRRNRTERLFLSLNIGIHLPIDEPRALPLRDQIYLPPDIGAAAMYMAFDLSPLPWIPGELLPRLGAGEAKELRQWELFYLGQRNYRDHPKFWTGRVEKSHNPALTAAWLDELGGVDYKPPV